VRMIAPGKRLDVRERTSARGLLFLLRSCGTGGSLLGRDLLINALQGCSGLADQCDPQHQNEAEYKGVFADFAAVVVPQLSYHDGRIALSALMSIR